MTSLSHCVFSSLRPSFPSPPITRSIHHRCRSALQPLPHHQVEFSGTYKSHLAYSATDSSAATLNGNSDVVKQLKASGVKVILLATAAGGEFIRAARDGGITGPGYTWVAPDGWCAQTSKVLDAREASAYTMSCPPTAPAPPLGVVPLQPPSLYHISGSASVLRRSSIEEFVHDGNTDNS